MWGAVGTTSAQISSGLAARDVVAVADTQEPLPGNKAQSTRRLGVGVGGGTVIGDAGGNDVSGGSGGGSAGGGSAGQVGQGGGRGNS